jgi:cation diffusion facilitator family transporter
VADSDPAEQWKHEHTFGTEQKSPGEQRTAWVITLTAAMMVIEIAAGMAYNSMALLADGWHMGTHAAALGITLFAYVFARRHARNEQFTFGTGKVGALGGFASAISLSLVALVVMFESAMAFSRPSTIQFDQAIGVAVVGLFVNALSALMLRGADHDHHDQNLRGAYLHVLADALTSVGAIAALVAGKYLGLLWMDPAMGIVGSLLIAKWSLELLRDSGAVLLDATVSPEYHALISKRIEEGSGAQVTDLHVWRVGPNHLAAIVSVVSDSSAPPEFYKSLLRSEPRLSHITVEVLPTVST